MPLNPTLKNALVRAAYIVGSLTIYYSVYNCLDYLDFHYWSDGMLIDGHPTLRYALLMIASAILIWVNIHKLSRPNIRLYYSVFLLGLGLLLIGAWKIGAFYLYSEHALLHRIYVGMLFYFGWFSVLISSILPIFLAKRKNAKFDRGSKIGFLIVVLLFDFTIAMPNIFGDETMEARIYGNENCYLIRKEWCCRLLTVTNPDDKIWRDSVVMRPIHYLPKDNSWWVADNGDSIRIENIKVYHSNLRVIHSNGKSYQVRTLGYAGNCWQYNAWRKIKELFFKEENN